MKLANYPILVFNTEAEALQAVKVIDLIGEAYYKELGYVIADNPRRVVPKNIKTGEDRLDAAGLEGWKGPFVHKGLVYILSPTPIYGEGWKARYQLANGPAYTEQMSPAEWFDKDGVPI
jgi:hypothetical protein